MQTRRFSSSYRFCTAVFASILLVAGLLTAPSLAGSPAAADTPVSAGELVPIAPVTLVSTSSGVGWSGQIQAGATQSVTASGVGGVPASGVSAVMLHVNTSNGSATGGISGNLWVYPAGESRPTDPILASSSSGANTDNTVIVQLGTGGKVSFYNGASASPVDVKANIEGYVTDNTTSQAGAPFVPLAPARIMSTITGNGGRSTPLTSSEGVWNYKVLGLGGMPTSGVSAVVLNVGASGASANCWVQTQTGGLGESNGAYPRTITYAGYPGQEMAVVQPDASGRVGFFTNCSSVDIFADVEGYYLSASASGSGDVYVPVTSPVRIVSTANDVGVSGKITVGRVVSGSSAVPLAGAGIPSSGVDAVALNLQTLNSTARGYNTVWTDGTSEPTNTSSIFTDPDNDEENMLFLRTGTNDAIDLSGHSNADPNAANDLNIDIEGYFVTLAPLDVDDANMCAMPVEGGCGSVGTVGSTSPTLTAWTSDQSGDPITYTFELWNSDGSNPTTLVSSATVPNQASGAIAAYTPGVLTDNAPYDFRVRASNLDGASGWSDWYQFATDAPVDHVIAPTAVYDSSASPLANGATATFVVAGTSPIPSLDTSGISAVDITATVTPSGPASGSVSVFDDQLPDSNTLRIATNGTSSVTGSAQLELSAVDGALSVTNQSGSPVAVTVVVNEWYSDFDFDDTSAATSDPDGADPGDSVDPEPAAEDAAAAQSQGSEAFALDSYAPYQNDDDDGPITANTLQYSPQFNLDDCTDGSGMSTASACADEIQSTPAELDADSEQVESLQATQANQTSYQDAAVTADSTATQQDVTDSAQPGTTIKLEDTSWNPGIASDIPGNCASLGANTPHYYGRFKSCTYFKLSANVKLDGQPVGTVDFEIYQVEIVDPKSSVATTSESFRYTDVKNADPLVYMNVNPTWKFARGDGVVIATAQNHDVEAVPPGEWDYAKATAAITPPVNGYYGSFMALSFAYYAEDSASKSLGATSSFKAHDGVKRRIDRMSYINMGKDGIGGVLPNVEPTIDLNYFTGSKNNVQKSVEFIKKAQNRIDGTTTYIRQDIPYGRAAHHPGKPGTGNTPLQRLKNPSASSKYTLPSVRLNRYWSCKNITIKKGSGQSCDEYPFASTYNGGFWFRRPDYSASAAINAEQNSDVGRQLGAFLQAERVIDSDKYWVQVTYDTVCHQAPCI